MAYACITVDLDTSWCYREIHGLPPRVAKGSDPMYSIGVRRLLDLFAEQDIAATLFVVGKDVSTAGHAALLREALSSGHELGNHSYSHDYALRTRSDAHIRGDLRRAHEELSALGDGSEAQTPVGFRAPGYNIDVSLFAAVERLGYRYDSSIFPCPAYWMAKAGVMAWRSVRGTPSRSARTPVGTTLAPLTPYRPREGTIARAGGEPTRPLEIPMCVVPGVRFPIIGTSLHLLGPRGFSALWPFLSRTHPRLLQLEFHAIDFMDRDDEGCEELVALQPDLAVPWPRKRALYREIFSKLRSVYQFATLREACRAF